MVNFVEVLGQVSERNSALFDIWSLVHVVFGITFILFINRPVLVLIFMVGWEPFELFLLSPWLWDNFGIIFGYEALSNSFSDMIFDAVGVAIGVLLLKSSFMQPFLLRVGRFRVK